MNKIPYTYRIIRYVHDPAVGEQLNIGIILYAPSRHFLCVKFANLYRRLSEVFINFDGENYRRHLNSLEKRFEFLAQDIQPRLNLFDTSPDLEALTHQALPDTGGSFQFSSILGGITDDPIVELEVLFDRMVTSQYRHETKTRRTNEDVWGVYQSRFKPIVRHQLKEKTFTTQEFDRTFSHAFKNGAWHVVEPVSMDYVDPSGMQNKAVDWLGNALALKDHPDLGKLYLLLGEPQNYNFRDRYNRVKDLLHKMPIPHQIVEENEATDFAESLETYMREQGLLPVEEAV